MADVNLPTQYPDLGTLFENMPAIGAWQVGAQQRLADQNNKSLQDAFAASQAYEAQKRPIELSNLQAEGDYKRAAGGYQNALSRASNINSDIGEATKDSAIKTQLGKDQLQQMQDLGGRLRSAGALVASMQTPWEKVAAAKQALGDDFITEHPEFEKLLMSNPQKLHTFLINAGTNIYNQSAAALMEMGKENTATERTRMQGDAARDVARINADSRRDVADMRVSITGKKPENMSQYEARIRQDAANGDSGAQEALAALERDKQARASAPANTNNQFKTDVITGQVGNKPNPLSQLPKGSKDNGDGTYTLPDGRRVRPKK